MSELRQRATLVDALGSALYHYGQAVANIPSLLRRILEEGAWQEFQTKLGEHVRHRRFEDFVTEPPLSGLGASMDLLPRIVADDPVTLDLLDQALLTTGGSTQGLNSSAKALRRLRQDRPDLHAEVLAGGLSVHGAMTKAGFRPRSATVPLDDPERLAAALRRRLDSDTLAVLSMLLSRA
jgi:hypothetical protein